jgi:hypothetical protein
MDRHRPPGPPALPSRGVAFAALLGLALWLLMLGAPGVLLGVVR